MRLTIYNTPIISSLVRLGAIICLKLSGWKVEGTPPKEKKYLVIAVPHQTNWDFPITLSMAFVLGFKIFWMGKHTLFKPPFGTIMNWLGGIAIYRNSKNNTVEQMIAAYKQAEELVIVIPPEGTRADVTKWKTGFYHIAVGANIPIVLGYIDYKNKIGGLGPLFHPTGDIEVDLPKIQSYYHKEHGIRFGRDE